MAKVAYISSGKIGIHRFTFNELIELEKEIDFVLCLTQLNGGPWMPKQSWSVLVASKVKSLLSFCNLIVTKAILCVSLINEARKRKVLPYFFIALSFYKDLYTDKDLSSLHCQMGDEKLYIGYFLKRLLKVPLTVTIHAHELYQREVYDENAGIRRLFSNCDKVLTISSFNADLLEDKFGVPKEKIIIMRLFPNIDNNKIIKDKTKILIVANWAEKKGYAVLLEAISKIKRNDFILWIVGGTYFSNNSIDVKNLIEKYAIQDKVALLGRLGSQILDIVFSACDIFCLPSITEYYEDGKPAEREGIPVALMEAMAWGKPVIATKHAGIPELVEDVLIEEENVEELISSIVYLLDNPDKRKEMGKRNYEIIQRKYSKDNIEILIETLKNIQNLI